MKMTSPKNEDDLTQNMKTSLKKLRRSHQNQIVINITPYFFLSICKFSKPQPQHNLILFRKSYQIPKVGGKMCDIPREINEE